MASLTLTIGLNQEPTASALAAVLGGITDLYYFTLFARNGSYDGAYLWLLEGRSQREALLAPNLRAEERLFFVSVSYGSDLRVVVKSKQEKILEDLARSVVDARNGGKDKVAAPRDQKLPAVRPAIQKQLEYVSRVAAKDGQQAAIARALLEFQLEESVLWTLMPVIDTIKADISSDS